MARSRTCGSSPSSSTAPARSASCTSPTSAPRSSRSRTRASAATSAATCRRTPRARTRCSSRPSTATSARLSLDLTAPAGRRVFEDLVRDQRRGLQQPARRRAGQDRHHATTTSSTSTRAIVCCSLTGFGMTGPRQAEPGYDYVLQALAGWMDLTGEPDGPPTEVGAVDGRLQRRLRRRDLAARRPPCRPPRRRRDGLRRQPLRHRDRTAHLPGGLAPQRRLPAGPHAALGPPVAGAVPGVRGRRRLAGRRLRQGEVLAATGGRRSTASPGRPTRGSRPSPTGTGNRDVLLPLLEEHLPHPHRGGLARAARARPAIPCAPDQRRRRPRWPSRTPRPATWSSRPSTRATARSARSPRRCGSAPQRPAYRRAPLRNEDADAAAVRPARLRRRRRWPR